MKIPRVMSRVGQMALVAGLLGAAALPALAETDAERIRALEQKLESSLKMIDRLANRIGELEKTAQPSVAAVPAKPATDEPSEAIARLQDNVNQLSTSVSKLGTDTGLPVHGFADVGAGWSNNKDPIKLSGFNGGTLDLYLTPQFGQRVKSLIELAVEYGTDGGVALDMERLQLGYTISDSVTLWAGRFHTPFGLWNTSFHHGANLQTSIYRPRFVDFEDKGGIIPAHSVGLWASGKSKLGTDTLTYDAYLSNGPKITERVLDFNAFTDNSANKMFGGNLGYRPAGALSGLTIGLHGFGSTVDTTAAGGAVLSSTKLRMLGGYLGYDADDWEAIGEYYKFSNTPVVGGSSKSSNAWFLQVGKTFDAWTPFMRVERVSLDASDNYFASQESGRSYHRTAVGARYALDAKASFKLELSRTSEKATTLLDAAGIPENLGAADYSRASVQYSVAF
jgi:hypothetical protein